LTTISGQDDAIDDTVENQRMSYSSKNYRVLLARAREGLNIFVPTGDKEDPARPPAKFNLNSPS